MDISSAYTRAKDAVSSTIDSYTADFKKANSVDNAPNLWTARGGKSAFADGKYDVKNHSYPSDLMTPDGTYGNSYVIFYINVATDSKLLTKHNAATVDDHTPRDRGDLIGMNMSKVGLAGSVGLAGAIEAGGAGALLAGKKGLATGAIAGGVAAVGVGVTTSLAPDAQRSQKRLKTAIALHIPNQLSVRYGVQWADEDTSILAMANAAGTEIMKAVSDDKKSDVTGTGAAIIANLSLSKGPQAGGVSAATGLAANPKKEQVFKGVDFRTFSFEYQFFPRDVTEANNVLRIIEEFKYHMHPEFKDNNNFVYIYPSEFDIMYYANGKENKNLHRHTSCVLTDMNINYTPNGVYSTFPNGMPTQINMTLNFRELALLTKDKVKDGL
jgi:hypothetical protein